MYDLILGGKVRVPTMTGSVEMTIPPETQKTPTRRGRADADPSAHRQELIAVSTMTPAYALFLVFRPGLAGLFTACF